MLNLHLADFSKPERALYKKVRSEGKCRGCGVVRSKHRVLSIGWLAGETIDPRGGVALCGHCLEEQKFEGLNLWNNLRPDEIVFAIKAYGSVEQARRALYPGDYNRTVERARREAA